MNKLIAELQRLYFSDDQPSLRDALARTLAGEANLALDLVSADATVRAMVISFNKAADWERVGLLYEAVRDDLELPAAAISVSGHKGYGLWFALAEPIPQAQAQAFLAALRTAYLADLPNADLEFHPDAGRTPLAVVPAVHPESGKWSAFIDPSMISMFVDGPWLEMDPNMDRQADILAGLEFIKIADLAKAQEILQTKAETAAVALEAAASPPVQMQQSSQRTLSVGNHYTDPKTFLLAVMNDPSASPRQRISAAKALLPYFNEALPG